MNLNHNPTIEDLRRVIGGYDHKKGRHVLWVTQNGDVRVTLVPRGMTAAGVEELHPDLQVQYEIFEAGNGYVGAEAAADEKWMNGLFQSLITVWPKRKSVKAVIPLDDVPYPEDQEYSGSAACRSS